MTKKFYVCVSNDNQYIQQLRNFIEHFCLFYNKDELTILTDDSHNITKILNDDSLNVIQMNSAFNFYNYILTLDDYFGDEDISIIMDIDYVPLYQVNFNELPQFVPFCYTPNQAFLRGDEYPYIINTCVRIINKNYREYYKSMNNVLKNLPVFKEIKKHDNSTFQEDGSRCGGPARDYILSHNLSEFIYNFIYFGVYNIDNLIPQKISDTSHLWSHKLYHLFFNDINTDKTILIKPKIIEWCSIFNDIQAHSKVTNMILESMRYGYTFRPYNLYMSLTNKLGEERTLELLKKYTLEDNATLEQYLKIEQRI